MIGGVTFGVIGLLFLFADIRTFASTFQQTFFGAPNTNLAIMATAVFATSFLALAVAWRLGPTRALGLSAAVFAIATFLTTASRNNWTDLALVVIALAAGFWWLAFLHSARTHEADAPLAAAVPIAFAADLAFRAAFRTVAVPDLDWSVAILFVFAGVVVFAVFGLATIAPGRRWTAPDLRGAIGLIAVPSLFFVAETGGTNGAQAAVAAGLGLGPEGSGATQTGEAALAAGIAVAFVSLLWRPARGAAAALLVAVGAALLWSHVGVASLIGAALLAAGCVLAGYVLLGGEQRQVARPTGTILALSVGWIVFAGGAFGFYAFWAFYPALWGATAFVIVAVLLARTPGARLRLPLAIAGCVIVLLPALGARAATPSPGEPLATRNTLRVETYNIHQGFNAGQIPSLSVIADVIAQEQPDVLCLQEVARGWLIDEGHDALSYLAERLGMRYVWLPAIGDLYGDALLSKFAMTDVKRIHYPYEGGKHQPRGAIGVRTSGVTIVCTHLDDVSNASIERQTQVRQILDTWTDTPTVILGDLNATPESIEIQLFDQSGFADLGAPAGETTTGDNPQKRIDYVFGKGVVGGQAHIAANNDLARLMQASDHRSLVVNITISR